MLSKSKAFFARGLGKLLRYEFAYYFRIMPILYLALAVLAFAAGIQLRQADAAPVVSENGFMLGSTSGGTEMLAVIWAFLFTAICIITVTMIIQRFRDNLLKDPGALMFTLPVTAWALTASKSISALCMIVLSALAGFISAFILGLGTGRPFLQGTDWKWFWDTILTGNNLLAGVVIMVIIFQQICFIYAILSACRILPRFRAIGGFAAYIAVMTLVEQPIITLVTRSAHYGFSTAYSYIVPFGIASAAFAALYFWLTGFLLKNTLNLE